MLKKMLTWGAWAFVIYYVAKSPQGAAHVADGALSWLKGAGSSLATFLNGVKFS